MASSDTLFTAYNYASICIAAIEALRHYVLTLGTLHEGMLYFNVCNTNVQISLSLSLFEATL